MPVPDLAIIRRLHPAGHSRFRGGILAFGILACAAGGAEGALIFKSATLGPTGQIVPSYSLNSDQWLAARFHVDVPTSVDHIGGHISGDFHNGFGAIVSVPAGSNSLPSFLPSDIESFALAATTVDFPLGPLGNGFRSSEDLMIPLSVTLTPGSYALIFGSGAFGATGGGGMTFNNTDTAEASYFYFNNNQNDWADGEISNARFTVYGSPAGAAVPERGTLALLAPGLIAAAAFGLQRRERRDASHPYRGVPVTDR